MEEQRKTPEGREHYSVQIAGTSSRSRYEAFRDLLVRKYRKKGTGSGG